VFSVDSLILRNTRALWVLRESFFFYLPYANFDIHAFCDEYGEKICSIVADLKLRTGIPYYASKWGIVREFSVPKESLRLRVVGTPFPSSVKSHNFRRRWENLFNPILYMERLIEDSHWFSRYIDLEFEQGKIESGVKVVRKIYVAGTEPTPTSMRVFLFPPSIIVFETAEGEYWTPRFGGTWIEISKGLEARAYLEGFIWPNYKQVRSIKVPDLEKYSSKAFIPDPTANIDYVVVDEISMEIYGVRQGEKVPLEEVKLRFAVPKWMLERTNSLVTYVNLPIFGALIETLGSRYFIGTICRDIIDNCVDFLGIDRDSIKRYIRYSRKRSLQELIKDNYMKIISKLIGKPIHRYLEVILWAGRFDASTLAESVGVTRARARQVIRYLASKGLIVEVRRGTYVVSSSLKKLVGQIEKAKNWGVGDLRRLYYAYKLSSSELINTGFPRYIWFSPPYDFVTLDTSRLSFHIRKEEAELFDYKWMIEEKREYTHWLKLFMWFWFYMDKFYQVASNFGSEDFLSYYMLIEAKRRGLFL